MKRSLCSFFTFLAAVAAGCGGETDAPGEAARVSAERPSARALAAPTCAPGAYRRLRTGRSAPAAVVVRPTSTSPRPGERATARFGVRNVNGVPTVLGVIGARVGRDCRPTWYRVQLPVKPNEATGWVRATDVRVGAVRTRVLVDLSERRVTLFREGRPVFSTQAAIGSDSDADADRRVLRQPAPRPVRSGRAVRPRRDRDLRLLRGADGVGAGRARGDPRDEPSRARRAGRLERMHPRRERRPAPSLARHAGRDAGGRARVGPAEPVNMG